MFHLERSISSSYDTAKARPPDSRASFEEEGSAWEMLRRRKRLRTGTRQQVPRPPKRQIAKSFLDRIFVLNTLLIFQAINVWARKSSTHPQAVPQRAELHSATFPTTSDAPSGHALRPEPATEDPAAATTAAAAGGDNGWPKLLGITIAHGFTTRRLAPGYPPAGATVPAAGAAGAARASPSARTVHYRLSPAFVSFPSVSAPL